MKLTYSLLCFYSPLIPLLAYPMDYNETAVEITRDALSNLQILINNTSFPNILQEYNDNISGINSRIYEKVTSKSTLFSRRLLELKATATNTGTDASVCLEKKNQPSAEEFYEKYTQDCANPARSLGLNLMTLGFNKQTIVFFKKYQELMNLFSGCMNSGDPAPRICAGVVESTLQEVKRIWPAVKANPVETEREFKQQIMVLSECAERYVASVTRRLQIEYNVVKTCVLDKINTS